MKMELMASISDTFDVDIGDFSQIHVTPSIQLRLQAENTATPFDVVQTPSSISQFRFAGDFEGIVVVGMDGVPAEISMRAYSPHLTSIDHIEFEVCLDIDLIPIQASELELTVTFHTSASFVLINQNYSNLDVHNQD